MSLILAIFLVLGGEPADIISYPYTVLVSTQSSRCTGILIDENWVLTAKHCLKYDTAYLTFSEDNLEISENEQFRQSSEFVFHPEHDIALIRVAKVEDVQPAEISSLGHYTGSAQIVGWGVIDWKNTLPNNLQVADIQLADNVNFDPEIFISTTGRNKGCQGDSGAPILVEGKLYAVHLTGFGCWGEWPTGNLKVSVVREFIEARPQPKKVFLPSVNN